jgi:lipopolysaccharide transport system ATP-binding protein
MNNLSIQLDDLSKSYLIQVGRPNYLTLRDKFQNLFDRSKNLSGQDVKIVTALSSLNLSIQKGQRVALIGKNGSGKSTLLKILSRIVFPSSGRATIHGSVASLLEVGTGFHSELSGRENIFLNGAIIGMRRGDVKKCFNDIVDFSEIGDYLDTPVKRYSSGMYVRLAFAVAAHLYTDVLLVDEVLAVGDESFQVKCINKMQEIADEGRTIVFVSHNMALVEKLCNRVILLDKGKVAFDGDTLTGMNEYHELNAV